MYGEMKCDIKDRILNILIANLILFPIYVGIWFNNIYLRIYGVSWTILISVFFVIFYKDKIKINIVRKNG